MFTKEDLKEFQSENLESKFQRTLAKVSEWYAHYEGNVYVSFSGGKDSTVLADICARWVKNMRGTNLYKPLHLVFVNTGLEYPEIQQHVMRYSEWLRNKYEIDVELEVIRPEMRFDEVIKTYGYPIIGKSQAMAIGLGRKNITDRKYSLRLCELGITPQEAKEMGLALPDSELLERYEKTVEGSIFKKAKYRALLDVDFNISGRCCDVMKKTPMKQYQKRPDENL